MRSRLLVIAAIAALLVLGSPTAPAQADHSWGGYHWARTANPFTLEVGDNVNSTWDTMFTRSVADWNRSNVLDLDASDGQTNPKSCNGTPGRVEVCNAAYGLNNWLGLATISIDRSRHITQGTVKVNDSWFSRARYNTPEWRQFVMCQEIGHTLGLDHQDEDFYNENLGTCMDYTAEPKTNQHPNRHDYEELEIIYRHLDSYTTVGVAGPATTPVGNNESSWGHRVEGSRAAGYSTYVRDLGGGRLAVTWVIWAR